MSYVAENAFTYWHNDTLTYWQEWNYRAPLRLKTGIHKRAVIKGLATQAAIQIDEKSTLKTSGAAKSCDMMQQVKDSFTRPVIAYTMSCIKDDILEERNKKKATKI